MNKREYRADRASWKLALAEGRVVRYPEMGNLVSYPTVYEALQAIAVARANGVAAQVVVVKDA